MQQQMRIPSNRLPAFVRQRPGVGLWLFLAGMAAGIVYLCVTNPLFLGAILIIAAVSWLLNAAEKRRQLRIAAERRAESICSFARSFDCRVTDTWIIRAVFDEFTKCVRFPVRPGDRFKEDLKFDSDDIDDLAETVAQRTGCPLDECQQNPLYGKVKTVRDFVEFFLKQPQRPRPAA